MKLSDKQQLDISFETPDGIRWANSSVLRSLSSDRILITPPVFHGDTVPIRQGAETTVMITKQDGAYKVEAVVAERVIAPERGLVLELYGQMERAQRRQFVRVPCSINVELAWISRTGPKNRKGTILDLSGGGLRVKLVGDACPDINSTVKLVFTIPETTEGISTDCKAVWAAGSRVRGWYVGLDFGSMTRMQRDRIVSYIVARQREILSKEAKSQV